MKLLLDHNLSYKLALQLREEYPESIAARQAGLSRAADSEIWTFAQTNGSVIVTKDSDFLQRSWLLGFPPKVIWLRVGNCSKSQILRLLRINRERIRGFEVEQAASLLVLG